MPVLTTCKDGEEAVETWRAFSFVRGVIDSASICGVGLKMREGKEADLVVLTNSTNTSSTSTSTQHLIVDREKRTHGE